MEKYQVEENENFFNQMLSYLEDDGRWIWPDAREIFYKSNGQLKAKTKRGYDLLKKIVSKKWFQNNVIQNF